LAIQIKYDDKLIKAEQIVGVVIQFDGWWEIVYRPGIGNEPHCAIQEVEGAEHLTLSQAVKRIQDIVGL
jgi:hypothetical protein